MTIKDVWGKMDKLMESYIPKIKKINSDKLDKVLVKSKLMGLFYKPDVYKYYMYLGLKTLGRSYKVEYEDAFYDKYFDVILYCMRSFNGQGSFSAYFIKILKTRIKDNDILVEVFGGKNKNGKTIISIDEPTKNNKDNKQTIGETIEGSSDYEPEENFKICQIIDIQAQALLLIKHIISVKEITSKKEEKYEKIFNKMYTSDFCNNIYKNLKETNYISKELLKHEKEIFDFMDLPFMDFFMVDESRTIEDISKNEVKTEKQIGISPEKDTLLKLPIEQRIYRFYYKEKLNVVEEKLGNMKHSFEIYKDILDDIAEGYKANHPEEEIGIIINDEEGVKNFIKRYVQGNYRNARSKDKK